MGKELLRRAFRDPIAQNAVALLGVRSTGYLLVLAIMPYLARVLGSTANGVFLIYQSFALWLGILLEYGFDFSATREVARWRNHRTRLVRIATGVIGVKGTLLVGSGLVVTALVPLVPIFRQYPRYLMWAWVWALGMGLRPLWYFQGIERLRLAAFLDISFRLLATAAVFVIVKSPQDGWKVLALYGSGTMLSSLLNLLRLYRRLPFRRPTLRATLTTFRMGLSMFVFRGAVSVYTVAGSFILGLLLPTAPALVANYGWAEKIVRALQGLLGCLSQAFYPRISNLVATNRPRAAHVARISLLLMTGIAVVMCIALVLAAPVLVRILLGEGYEGAVPILRFLALLIPLVGLSSVLGIQWMLPLGMDRAFNVIIITAGLINLALAVVLVPLKGYVALGPMGMVWAVIVAELFVTSCVYIVLRRRKLDPLFQLNRAE